MNDPLIFSPQAVTDGKAWRRAMAGAADSTPRDWLRGLGTSLRDAALAALTPEQRLQFEATPGIEIITDNAVRGALVTLALALPQAKPKPATSEAAKPAEAAQTASAGKAVH